jgi:phenylacetate-CoA ligase
VTVELARDGRPDHSLANSIGERIRARLTVRARVELVPWGSLQRSEYKSQLLKR